MNLQMQLGVCKAAMVGNFVDKKSQQSVNKCTQRVVKELDDLKLTCDQSVVKVSGEAKPIGDPSRLR